MPATVGIAILETSPAHAGPLSSLVARQVASAQEDPENMEICESLKIGEPQRLKVTVCPFPANTYQTPGVF